MSEIVMLLCELKVGQRGQANSSIRLKESFQGHYPAFVIKVVT